MVDLAAAPADLRLERPRLHVPSLHPHRIAHVLPRRADRPADGRRLHPRCHRRLPAAAAGRGGGGRRGGRQARRGRAGRGHRRFNRSRRHRRPCAPSTDPAARAATAATGRDQRRHPRRWRRGGRDCRGPGLCRRGGRRPGRRRHHAGREPGRRRRRASAPQARRGAATPMAEDDRGAARCPPASAVRGRASGPADRPTVHPCRTIFPAPPG